MDVNETIEQMLDETGWDGESALGLLVSTLLKDHSNMKRERGEQTPTALELVMMVLEMHDESWRNYCATAADEGEAHAASDAAEGLTDILRMLEACVDTGKKQGKAGQQARISNKIEVPIMRLVKD